MKIKVLGAIAISAALLSAQATMAQSTVTGAAGSVNAPASSVKMAPGIATGVRSSFENEGSGQNNEVGAYITPSFELSYKGPKFNFGLNFELEMFSGKGFGSAKDASGLAKNSYVVSHPVVVAGYKIDPNWALKSVTDTAFKIYNQADQKNIELASINELQRTINDRLTVSAGYRLDYISLFGTSLKANGTTADLLENQTVRSAVVAGAPVNKADLNKAFQAANPNYGENPSIVGHSGLARAVVKISNTVTLNTYVIAGVLNKEQATNTTSYRYRLQNTLAVSAIKDLDLSLVYRIQWENPKGAADGSLMNRGVVEAAYNLNTNWAVEASNDFIYVNSFNKKNAIYNETYLGAAYKF